MPENNKQVEIELKKSLIGRHKKHIATANSLGLRKIGDSNVLSLNPCVEGKIKQIAYLLEVRDI